MRKIHPVSFGNALIWGATIIAAAVVLRGTEHTGIVLIILAGAAGASVVIVGNALRRD